VSGGSKFNILVVRLGAMGDIIHALPAVASLRKSFPEARIVWVTAPRWRALLDNNPNVDEVIPFRRSGLGEIIHSWRRLRPLRPRLAIDFQGLMQSALVGRASRPHEFWGWDKETAREPGASLFYNRRLKPNSAHVVDQNVELAAAGGAMVMVREFHLPQGTPEGELPARPFVLAHPFAGWTSKQWPLENYGALATWLAEYGIALVANVPPDRATLVAEMTGVHIHSSSLGGLIAATRSALAVVGLDSGPMHLAAALGKPGVALFGPTDPARNGPYGGSLRVLRAPSAVTSYKRGEEISPSMRAIEPEQVFSALMAQIHASEPQR
jgi:heptosyltransferase I